MSPRRLVPALTLTLCLGACSLLRQNVAGPRLATSPVAASTVWPAPGGNLTTCTPSGPGGDAPVPRGPADTIKVRSKTARMVVATLCSFSVPVREINNGQSQDPLQ